MTYIIQEYSGSHEGEYLLMFYSGGFTRRHSPFPSACRLLGSFYNAKVNLTIFVNDEPYFFENITTEPFWTKIGKWGSSIRYEISVEEGIGDFAGQPPEIEELRFGSDPGALI